MKTTTKMGYLVLLGLLALSARAVKVGDSRESVIAERGHPQSKMSAGSREFLNYSGGRVILVDGRVSEYTGTLTGEASPRSPSPRAPGKAVSRESRIRHAHWWTNMEQARASATKQNKLVLALFTGSDWCPPCKKFEAEVAHDQQFIDIFSSSFVFFKCDWLRNTPQSPQVEAEVKRLRRKYGIRSFPTLMVLNANGEILDTVEWTKVRGGTFREAMIEAIDNSRKATKGGQKASSSWWPF